MPQIGAKLEKDIWVTPDGVANPTNDPLLRTERAVVYQVQVGPEFQARSEPRPDGRTFLNTFCPVVTFNPRTKTIYYVARENTAFTFETPREPIEGLDMIDGKALSLIDLMKMVREQQAQRSNPANLAADLTAAPDLSGLESATPGDLG